MRADGRHCVAEPEKGLGRAMNHPPDTEHRDGTNGEVHTEERYFISSPPLEGDEAARARVLDGGKLSLVPGCDFSKGWEPYLRETGSL